MNLIAVNIMTHLAAKQVHCDGDLVLASFLSSRLITRQVSPETDATP